MEAVTMTREVMSKEAFFSRRGANLLDQKHQPIMLFLPMLA